ENNSLLKLYPNPATSNIFIEAALDKITPVNIFITDALGKKVKTIWQGNYKDATLTADVRNLAGGIYFVHLVAGDEKITRKLIISK
ncbi:MAG: T9SS type A sorting domain-containing protein, partial [Bacteroidia bacterium]